MALVDFEALKSALSDEAPCGPDLDADFDDDYMNFVANLEGLLPTTFFQDGLPFTFDPALIDVDQQQTHCLDLLQRTRDLRLLVLLARTYILDRDLANFAQTVDVMTGLLARFWDAVHPQAEGGRFAMRAAILGMLDEPTVVFSLQYCRLCETRRQGPVTFRSYLYATREAEPREGEEAPGESTLLQAMRESEEQIAATRASLESLRDNFRRIGALWAEHADLLSSPSLSNVSALVLRILAFVDLASPLHSGQVATPASADQVSPGAPQSSTKLACAADAVRALKAATAYFLRQEPSSPVLPLVIQAQQLLGKSFPEVLQALLPDQAASAAYQIGARQFFSLPIDRLPAFETSGSTYDDVPNAAAESAAHAGEDHDALDRGAGAHEETAHVAASDPPLQRPSFRAETRAQALSLLDDVSAYLNRSEPGSPVPWLIERARALAERDFLSILRAVLPESALTDLDQN